MSKQYQDPSFVSPQNIGLIESSYILKGDRLEILRFLETHFFLIPLVIEAYANIKKDFPFSKVFLRTVNDPEEVDPDEADKLVASITTNLDVDEATDTLSRFDKRWGLNAWKRAYGKFNITLEF